MCISGACEREHWCERFFFDNCIGIGGVIRFRVLCSVLRLHAACVWYTRGGYCRLGSWRTRGAYPLPHLWHIELDGPYCIGMLSSRLRGGGWITLLSVIGRASRIWILGLKWRIEES